VKGYFSRIAKQSGLRFSSKGTASHRRRKEFHAVSSPELLDLEETIIVPSPVGSKSSETKDLKRDRKSEQPATENIALKSNRKKAMANPDRRPVLTSSDPETTASPIGRDAVFVSPETESSREMQALSSGESPVPAASESAPAELVKSVFIEPSGTTDRHERQAPDPDRTSFSEPETPKKQYFSKTAENIERRDIDPAEVQTILLHEIQEWVAEGNSTEAAEVTESDKSIASISLSHEAPETHEVVLTKEREPGVVRIGEKRLPASVPKEASRVDEQSFDLSIGTISVVIEGDDRPPQPASEPRMVNRPREHDTDRRWSRLGRNYL